MKTMDRDDNNDNHVSLDTCSSKWINARNIVECHFFIFLLQPKKVLESPALDTHGRT